MCTFSRCRSKFVRTRGHVRSRISGVILVSWFVAHQSSSVLHTSKNSTIGGIFRRTLPATSTRMRLLIKSFYSSFSSFIFSYEATAYQDVNFERVFLWFRFVWAFVAGQSTKFHYFTRVFFLCTFFCSCGGQTRLVKSPCVHRTEYHYLNQCMQTSLSLKPEDKTDLYLWLQERSLFDPETLPRKDPKR